MIEDPVHNSREAPVVQMNNVDKNIVRDLKHFDSATNAYCCQVKLTKPAEAASTSASNQASGAHQR